jgi:2-C-methyl-D-erythritol 4-phosphate cytidylyltransferase
MRVFVILPAAGLGTRMAAPQRARHAGDAEPAGHALQTAPKQFLAIAGVPILIHTLRAFAAAPEVTSIVIAVRAAERERLAAELHEYGYAGKVSIAEGGSSRQESVLNALRTLECDADDIVLVHDAVRPLIEPAVISRVIEAVEKHGAAIVGLPAVDTIKQVERTADGAIVTATIPREYIVQAQTPQGFRCGLLRQAFAEAEGDGFQGTDEASIVERAGTQVFVVPGSSSNIKITQPGDLELAEFFLAHRHPG